MYTHEQQSGAMDASARVLGGLKYTATSCAPFFDNKSLAARYPGKASRPSAPTYRDHGATPIYTN